MSVARADGTAARPLDWGAPTGHPPERQRRTRPVVPSPTRPAPRRSSGRTAPDRGSRPSRRSRLTAGQVWLFAVCWLGLVAGAMAVVARHAAIAEAGYRISAAEQQLAELRHENMLLEAEVARLADPERIYAIATEKLGMVPRERFEVTVVAPAAPVARPDRYGPAVAAIDSVRETAAQDGFWASLGRTVVGWLTGKAPPAAAKSPDQ